MSDLLRFVTFALMEPTGRSAKQHRTRPFPDLPQAALRAADDQFVVYDTISLFDRLKLIT